LSVIVPTLNESENVDAVVEAILAQATAELDLEVLIADGGSSEGTAERVRAWQAKAPVRFIEGGGGRGLAGDVLIAAEQASSPIIVVLDADLSYPPTAIPELVAPIVAGTSDMVMGSRYAPGGLTPDWPLRRWILSRIGGALAWPLADVSDPMSGFFAAHRSCLLAVDPSAAGFKIGLEIMAAGGSALRVSEVPITFSDRTRGAAKIGFLQLAALAGADGSGWGCGFDGKCGTLCRRRRDGARHRLYCLHRPVYGRGKSGGLSCRQFRSGHSFQLHAQLLMVLRSDSGRSTMARLASIWAVPHRLPYGAFSPRRCFGNRNRCLGLGA
jgi:glycosyltransferase involved in cell wall biosynthesis